MRAIRTVIGPKPEILAVVKANAYGHGSLAVAGAIREDVAYFGVACVEEARPLRSLGRDILLLSPCLPEEYAEAVEAGDIVTVSSAREAAAYAALGPCRVNLKIDTGMGRLGCAVESAPGELAAIAGMSGVEIHSISSHLPVSDEDPSFTTAQLKEIGALRELMQPLAPRARWHVLNSAGIFLHSDSAMDVVRSGLAVYGSASPPGFQDKLVPAMKWKARVLLVKTLAAGSGVSYGRTFVAPHEMRVASVSAGYADGYPRQVSGRGASVLIHGHRCRILGRVTMDQIIVDVGDMAVEAGDDVVLMGRDGEEEIPAAELAAWGGTIAWHIFTGISNRVARHYIAG
ncbi:MAG: alanine racemase [Terrimicrobiaceae bacterium]